MCIVESALQRWEVLQQRGPQTRQRTVAVHSEICAPSAQQAQIHRCFVTLTKWLQIATHASLVGDDRRVLGIGFPVAAVGGGGVAHDAAGDVNQILLTSDQQSDQQCSAAGIKVDRPLNMRGQRLATPRITVRSSRITANIFRIGQHGIGQAFSSDAPCSPLCR
jgi:hypothetical protein